MIPTVMNQNHEKLLFWHFSLFMLETSSKDFLALQETMQRLIGLP